MNREPLPRFVSMQRDMDGLAGHGVATRPPCNRMTHRCQPTPEYKVGYRYDKPSEKWPHGIIVGVERVRLGGDATPERLASMLPSRHEAGFRVTSINGRRIA